MIYLDNAATTFPKPKSVYRAVSDAIVKYGGNPGRSGHKLSRAASSLVYSCREEIASFFGGSAECVVFTQNATHAINLALNALGKRGGTALISSLEHNAVLRTVNAIGKYRVFDALCDDERTLASFKEGLSFKPDLVVCTHASNLCGRVLPVERIGRECQRLGIPFIIDASQTAGRLPLDIKKANADVICAPGHKGLYGIQGCGFALFSDKYRDSADKLSTYVYGGNGVNSLDIEMPDFLPERYEAGTLQTPAIASLSAGIKEVRGLTLDAISFREELLGKRLKEGLSVIRGVKLYGGEWDGGTVLFNLDGYDSERVCEHLDAHGICVRGGFHCCPLGHSALGSVNGGVRASVSYFNTFSDVDGILRTVAALK